MICLDGNVAVPATFLMGKGNQNLFTITYSLIIASTARR